MKASYFDKCIKVEQIGLADLIFRSSFLMMNWKLPFIQGRQEDSNCEEGRPCKS